MRKILTFVLWFTGLPCSGKSTIARKLCDFIPNLAVLDGDEIRKWFSSQDFSREGIQENNKRVAYVSKLLFKHNVPVCVAVISPFAIDRERSKKIVNDEKFIQVYLKCSAQICENRDVGEMYRKARDGIIKDFIGIDSRYEIPKTPDLIVDTENSTVAESVETIIDYLKSRKLIK